MIPHPDPCPGPAEFTSTDIALVINKECLTRLIMEVSTTSLGTDRSHFPCVCSAVDIVGHLFLSSSVIQKL